MNEFDPLTFDPNKVAAELSKRGHAWADADAAAHLLEESTKSILAVCMVRLDAKSVAEAEARARACDEYKNHLAATAKARQMANKARVDFDVYRTWIELVRSKMATARAEMTLR